MVRSVHQLSLRSFYEQRKEPHILRPLQTPNLRERRTVEANGLELRCLASLAIKREQAITKRQTGCAGWRIQAQDLVPSAMELKGCWSYSGEMSLMED